MAPAARMRAAGAIIIDKTPNNAPNQRPLRHWSITA